MTTGILGLVGHPYNGVGPMPAELVRPCRVVGCKGTLRPVEGTQVFAEDGHADAFLKCDRCPAAPSVTWDWRHFETC